MDSRYSRQMVLPGFGADSQRRLAEARALVIGAGGLGSSVIPALAAAGVGTIGIVDDDRVELSNLHRQHIHGMADVGRSKAQSAADAVAALNPDTRVIALEQRLSNSTALEMFAHYDLVVDGSDNFPTRYLVDDASALSGTPVVWGSVSQYGGQASVAWAERGPTYRDLFPVPPSPASVLSCSVGGVLPTTVGVIGSILATEAIKIITGIGRPLIGRVTSYDALTGVFRELEFARDPAAPPVTGLIDYEAFCGIVPALSPRGLAALLAKGGPPNGSGSLHGSGSRAEGGPPTGTSRLDGSSSADERARLLRDAVGAEITLLDVREPWEAELASLPGSVLVPLGSLVGALDSLDPDRRIVVYCHHGGRSAEARRLLAARGFDASHLEGGIDAWSRDVDPSLPRY